MKPIVQLLSRTVAKGIEYCSRKGLIENLNWLDNIIFKAFSEWFDGFNSRHKYGKHDDTNAYGIDFEKTNDVLAKMNDIIKNIRLECYNTLLPFQLGILVNDRSLRTTSMELHIL